MASWARLVDRARDDPAVVGLILSGSRGRGLGSEHSDWDCYVVTAGALDQRTDEALAADGIDAVTLSIAEFDAHASPGSAEAWNAYAFAHVEVVVDKLDGEVGSIAASKEFLDAGVAGARARDRLDAFLNSAVRAAKSYRVGQVAAASLDAADAIAPALETVFAIQRRVRPYNGYLAWELDRHPLELVGDADRLVSAVIDVASGSNAGPPTALVRSVEKIARLAGLGGVIDAWDDASLTLIRGD